MPVDNPTHLGSDARRVIEDHSTELLLSAADRHLLTGCGAQ